jgi:hypothetical protein
MPPLRRFKVRWHFLCTLINRLFKMNGKNLKNHIKKIIIWAFSGILLILTVLILGVSLWFDTPIVARLLPKVSKHYGVNLQLKGFYAHAEHRGLGKAQFEVSSEKISMDNPESFSGEIESLKLKFTVNWFHFPPQIEKINEFRMQLPKFEAKEGPKAIPAESSNTLPDLNLSQRIPSWLNSMELGEILVYGKDLPKKGYSLSIEAPLQEQNLKLTLNGAERGEFAFLKIPLDEKRRLNLFKASGEANLFLGSGFGKRGVLHVKVRSLWKGNDINVDIAGSLLKIHPWLPRLMTQPSCILKIDSSSKTKLSSEFRCGITADMRLPPIPGVPKLQRPSRTDLNVSITASYDGTNVSGKAELNSSPVLAPFMNSSLQVNSDFKGNLKENTKNTLDKFHHNTSLQFNARILQIEKPIELLHDTVWAVPAPLNNLRGAVTLALTSRWKDWSSEIPFEFSTALESIEQSLKTKIMGKAQVAIEPAFSASVKGECSLDDVRLSAPRLSVQNIPRFFPDSNINTKPLVKPPFNPFPQKKTSVIAYDLGIHTPREMPLRIDSNLIRGPVSIDIKAHLKSDTQPLADINVRPFPFEVFRRKATLQEFRYWNKKPLPEPGDLSGKVQVEVGEAKVFANLYGHVDKVKVELASDPPVPQDELWALLLFGEPLDSLDMDQQDSSQSTSRAVSRGALGLFSLYALSSTPVERVDYDPTTQNVSVRFKIKEGTSLVVGHSEEEAASLGLRKRIGKGWTLNAKVSEGDDDSEKKDKAQAGATLEWSSRY